MKNILLFFLLISLTVFAEEENIVSEGNEIPPSIQKSLRIKTEKLKEREISVVKKYPAVVKDDLTLSEDIYSPLEGLVKKLFVKEGDRVKKGQKLAYVYSPEIAKLITQIKQAEALASNYRELYENEKALYQKKVISYSRYFNAKIQYKNALAKLNALKKQLSIYGEVEKGYLVLKSHIDGYIAHQEVVLGDSVGLDKKLFKIHAHDRVWTVAFVPVKDTSLMKKGEKAVVLSPIGEAQGVVDYIGHYVDKETKRVPVRIITDNSKDVLKPGMFVDVKISLENIKGLFVPASAVALTEEGSFVFKKEGNSFEAVKVKLGKRINGLYQVLSGVKEGDEIVVKGTIYLKAKFFGEAEE